MRKIDFNLSNGLYYKLLKLKKELSKDENSEISFSDLIEEALISYFNIKISDINFYENESNSIDSIIIDNINKCNSENNYYVYVYYNTKKKSNKQVGDYIFLYEPIYIGKGKNNRINDLNDREKNLIECINELKLTNDFKAEKIIDNLNEVDAFNYEQLFINSFGRLNNGTGTLFNKREGCTTTIKKLDNNSNINLEYNFIEIILNTLNETKRVNKTAKKLNISVRTLYRKIDKYSLKRDVKTKNWYIDAL